MATSCFNLQYQKKVQPCLRLLARLKPRVGQLFLSPELIRHLLNVPQMSPRIKFFQRCDAGPNRVPEQIVEFRFMASDDVFLGKDLGSYFGVSVREAGTAADNEDDDVNVVGGAPVLEIPEFKSEGFKFSENVRGKGLEGQFLSKGVVHTSGLPQI